MQSLSSRFALRISVLILGIGLVFTVIASYWLWQAEQQAAIDTVRQSISATLPSLDGSLWNFDFEATSATLSGLEQVPEVGQAWIETVDAEGWITADGMVTPDPNTLPVPDHSRPIIRPESIVGGGEQLGVLHITHNFEPARQHALTLLAVLLLAIALMLSGMVLAVGQTFRRLVGQPLREIAAYLGRSDLLTNEERLRISGPSASSQDELGRLERTINTILADRRADLRELEQYRDRLEERVRERTAELQAAQEELLRTENLAALGSLVAGIAHELNTPIGNGLVAATTISEQCPRMDEKLRAGSMTRGELEAFLKQTLEAARIIETTLGRARELVQNFKQVAVDRQSEHRREFDPDEVVEETLATLLPTLKRTPFCIERDLRCANEGVVLDSYPGPFGQVVMNLVENAVKHGFDNRDHGVVRIGSRTWDGKATLTVEDDGVGMTEADRKRVFEPFFTTKLGKGGSGLGMSIVHRLVTEVMGGTIEIESTPGRGTLFTVTVPQQAPMPDNAARQPTRAGESRAGPGGGGMVAGTGGVADKGSSNEAHVMRMRRGNGHES